MPRLLLEGKSITELLARVRAEHGDDVTIVAAEKVRTGGVGGFFTKESYSLTVEVDAAGGSAAGGSTVPVAAVMHDRTVELHRTNRTSGDASVMHDLAVDAPGSLLDLAAAIDEAEATENSVILATRPMHTPPVQLPTLSTASPEFASILARLNALDGGIVEDEPELPTSPEKDAYTRLREALVEIAPHIDFNTSVPLVLVIPPAVAAPQPPVVAALPIPVQPATPLIPQQGRHRRASATVAD